MEILLEYGDTFKTNRKGQRMKLPKTSLTDRCYGLAWKLCITVHFIGSVCLSLWNRHLDVFCQLSRAKQQRERAESLTLAASSLHLYEAKELETHQLFFPVQRETKVQHLEERGKTLLFCSQELPNFQSKRTWLLFRRHWKVLWSKCSERIC